MQEQAQSPEASHPDNQSDAFSVSEETPLKEILSTIALHEIHGEVWWNSSLQFFVNCSDLFCWACSDAEPILTMEDVRMLDQACRDSPENGPLLYCARRRKMRPQGAYYKFFVGADLALFDQCGEFREAGFGNPVESGARPETKS